MKPQFLHSLLPIALLAIHTSAAQAQFVPAPVDGARFSLTTTQAVGQTITLNIKSNASNVWIDLNGDGAYQEGEQVALSGSKAYTLERQSLTVFGDLTQLICNNSQLTLLELTKLPNLTALACNFNKLTTLDLSNVPKIGQLYCTDNRLESLTLKHSASLVKLDCRNNQLESIELEGAPKLSELFCQGNQLASIVFSANPELGRINCSDNKLTSVALTGLGELTYLDCAGNQLEGLDLTPTEKLEWLVCLRNQIKGPAMQALVESLPKPVAGELYPFDPNAEGGDKNVCSASHAAIAKKKNWRVLNPDGEELPVEDIFEPAPTDGARVSFVTHQVLGERIGLRVEAPEANVWIDLNGDATYQKGEEIALSQLAMYAIERKNLTIYGDLTQLETKKNNLVSLDLSKVSQLNYLDCSGNQLKQLDVDQVPKLKELYCFENELSELVFAALPSLTHLYCFGNQIKEEAMQSLIERLPTPANKGRFRPFNTGPTVVEKNICTKKQAALAKSKNWQVQDALGNDFLGINASDGISSAYPPISLHIGEDRVLRVTGVESGISIVVYSLDGCKLYSEVAQSREISTSLPSGSYLLCVGDSFRSKVIIP